jgi:hypothetical protein
VIWHSIRNFWSHNRNNILVQYFVQLILTTSNNLVWAIMMKFMKKFDVHAKAMDGVNQQSLVGGIASIVAVITVLFLIVSETSFYVKKDVVSRMQPDSVIGPEIVKFDLALDFDTFPCDKLEFAQEVTRGTIHQHVDPVLSLETGPRGVGCLFSTVIETDKVSGSVRIGSSEPIAPDTDTVVVLGGKPTKAPGDVETKKDNLHIGHTVKRILFKPPEDKSAADKFPEIKPPLIGVKPDISAESAIQHYAIQIVPTYHKGY